MDCRRFETLLGEVIHRHSLVLYAYALMPKHFHLLLEVGRVPLSKAIQALRYRYTHRYNQRYRNIGHLFQGRYKAILCDRDSYLMELRRYLHLNPVRAGMVSDPRRYSWSSPIEGPGIEKIVNGLYEIEPAIVSRVKQIFESK